MKQVRRGQTSAGARQAFPWVPPQVEGVPQQRELLGAREQHEPGIVVNYFKGLPEAAERQQARETAEVDAQFAGKSSGKKRTRSHILQVAESSTQARRPPRKAEKSLRPPEDDIGD